MHSDASSYGLGLGLELEAAVAEGLCPLLSQQLHKCLPFTGALPWQRLLQHHLHRCERNELVQCSVPKITVESN